MNRINLAACLILTAGICAASEPPKQDFECDTPGGHFSYWKRTVTGGPIDITCTLTVNELRKDGKWTPTVHVLLKGGDKASFGVHLFTVAKADKMFFIEFMKPGGNEKLGLGFVPSTQDPIPFEIHLDASGQVRVSFAGSEASAPAGEFKASELQLSCSTGDFEFKDFVVRE